MTESELAKKLEGGTWGNESTFAQEKEAKENGLTIVFFRNGGVFFRGYFLFTPNHKEGYAFIYDESEGLIYASPEALTEGLPRITVGKETEGTRSIRCNFGYSFLLVKENEEENPITDYYGLVFHANEIKTQTLNSEIMTAPNNQIKLILSNAEENIEATDGTRPNGWSWEDWNALKEENRVIRTISSANEYADITIVMKQNAAVMKGYLDSFKFHQKKLSDLAINHLDMYQSGNQTPSFIVRENGNDLNFYEIDENGEETDNLIMIIPKDLNFNFKGWI